VTAKISAHKEESHSYLAEKKKKYFMIFPALFTMRADFQQIFYNRFYEH
jgi:hypothetical protein